jgi:cytokinesis protein
MDDLLQKLRAAKPEARDQRDRRRRARLKDKHQVRVASGQKIPEIGVNMENGGEGAEGEDEKSKLLSPASETAESEASSTAGPAAGTASTAEADIADRAAAMLEGLQSGTGLNKDGSLSVRRRRESADTERQRRRNRRNQATSAKSEDGGILSPTAIPEEGDGDGDRAADQEGEETRDPTTPVTVVHPPSPEQKGRDLPTPPPEEA